MLFDYTDPRILAEGRVGRVCLNPLYANDVMKLFPDKPCCKENPLVLKYIGKDKHYISIYIHCDKITAAYENENYEEVIKLLTSNKENFLCGLRRKKGIYFVINDIGTLDMNDNGIDENLLLTHKDMIPRNKYRIIAIHHSTGISLAEKRKINIEIDINDLI